MANDLYGRALAWLARRSLTAAEMSRRLQRAGADAATAAAIVDRLCQSGLLDDRRLAEQFVARALAEGRLGPGRIRQQLQARGVPTGVVDPLLQHADEGADWQKIAEIAAARYDRREPRQRARLARHLARQGFPSAVIIRILEQGTGSEVPVHERSDQYHGFEDY